MRMALTQLQNMPNIVFKSADKKAALLLFSQGNNTYTRALDSSHNTKQQLRIEHCLNYQHSCHYWCTIQGAKFKHKNETVA